MALVRSHTSKPKALKEINVWWLFVILHISLKYDDIIAFFLVSWHLQYYFKVMYRVCGIQLFHHWLVQQQLVSIGMIKLNWHHCFLCSSRSIVTPIEEDYQLHPIHFMIHILHLIFTCDSQLNGETSTISFQIHCYSNWVSPSSTSYFT